MHEYFISMHDNMNFLYFNAWKWHFHTRKWNFALEISCDNFFVPEMFIGNLAMHYSMHGIVIHGLLLTIYEVYISWKVFVGEGIDKSILATGYEV